jgi:hypothetical protein
VQECWVAGDRILLHRKCEAGWLATPDPNGGTFNALTRQPGIPELTSYSVSRRGNVANSAARGETCS